MELHKHTGKFQNPGFSENAPELSVVGLLTEGEAIALRRPLAKKNISENITPENP